MRSRGPLRLFPKVIRAGAGPHDLGPGDNTGDTLPELMVQSEAEATLSDDDDHVGRWTPTTDDIGPQPDAVVRNTPYDREYDSWGAVADYVFQNSNATSVLMHHRDLAGIRTGGEHDISFLLVKNRPRIIVDESGVGRIVCRQEPSQQREVPAITSLYPASSDMHKIPDTTEERITFIAQGRLDPVEDPVGASQLLKEMFDAENYSALLHDYPPTQEYIDGLYKAFNDLSFDSEMGQRCFRALRKAVGVTRLLPACYYVSSPLKRPDMLPSVAGESSEVWKAIDINGATFALKIFRVTQQNDFFKIKKRFCKEVLVAKQVQNDYVLAIAGVQIIDKEFHLCIVSEWMENGNMHTFLEDNLVPDCAQLLLKVIKGLNYLHSIGVVHGDLKSANILIDAEGNPRLTASGLLSINRILYSADGSWPKPRGSIRWAAPELLSLSTDPLDLKKFRFPRPTFKSDMYSLAMVTIEIFTGNWPFASHGDEQVILMLAKDMRPDKPVHGQFTPKMWTLTKKCWNKDPKKRPSILEVLRKLEPEEGNDRHNPFSAWLSSRMNLHFGERTDTNN